MNTLHISKYVEKLNVSRIVIHYYIFTLPSLASDWFFSETVNMSTFKLFSCLDQFLYICGQAMLENCITNQKWAHDRQKTVVSQPPSLEQRSARPLTIKERKNPIWTHLLPSPTPRVVRKHLLRCNSINYLSVN